MSNRIKSGYADLTRNQKRHHLRTFREDHELCETLVLKRLDGAYDLYFQLDETTLTNLIERVKQHPVKHATLYTTSNRTGHIDDIWREVDWHDASAIHKHRLSAETLDTVLGTFVIDHDIVHRIQRNDKGPLRLLALFSGQTVYQIGDVVAIGYPAMLDYVTKHHITDETLRQTNIGITRYITEGFGGLRNVESYPVFLNRDETETKPESEG